ncbi:hypothetical protein A9Q74_17560 [Colwellia sp. 39_35_sub15_T18]|nr:hypothetical protein A9Q74_17560 [Colwellia sp. 39_35_sub15_T18]
MALVILESLRISIYDLRQPIFKAKQLSLQGINNAIFDGIYSNKDKKTSIAGFFCFDGQKYRFSLIFTLIVTKISKYYF